MEISYILLIHKSAKQVKRLIDALSSQTTKFYLHVDKKSNIAPFKKELTGYSNVYFLPEERRCNGQWGGFELVQATLNAMEMITMQGNSGYCILLSGQDYPVKSNDYINEYLLSSQGAQWMTFFDMPRPGWWPFPNGMARINQYLFRKSPSRYDFVLFPSVWEREFYKPFIIKEAGKLLVRGYFKFLFKLLKKRKFPDYLTPFGGHQWWALTTDVVFEIREFLKSNPDYITYHQDTLVPDEMFFQPILHHLLQNKSLIRPCLTYANWTRDIEVLPVTFVKEDFEELKSLSPDILFARKFDIEKDDKILDKLDELRLTA